MDDIVSSTANQSQQQADTSAIQAAISSCSKRASSIDTTSEAPFQVNEIICLENNSSYLYGEVIQLLRDRGLCWFRPMCLVVYDRSISDRPSPIIEPSQLIDLQSGSDLLWPITLFRPALDTEVISLLPLLSDRYSLAERFVDKQYLNRFIQQVWQDNRDKF